MKKYYIGLIVLMVLALGLAGYTISQGSAAKKDKETTSKLDSVATKLDEYNSRYGTIAPSLEAAGVNNVPPTITYKKLSDSEYKLCVTFYQASNGFDAGWAGLFGGLAGAGQGSQDNSTHTYLDTFSLIYSHKKGETCQTVKPYSYNYGNYDIQGNPTQSGSNSFQSF